MTRPLDPAGQALIKGFEGLRLQSYDDYDGKPVSLFSGEWRRADGGTVRGVPTIGWGRRILPGETITVCTRAQADAWFDEMMANTYLPPVDRQAPGANDHERSAMASFCYNCGPGNLTALIAGGITKDRWLSFCRTKGVVNAGLQMRRAKEYALYVTPVPLTDRDVSNILASVAATSTQIMTDLFAEQRRDTEPPPDNAA